MECLAPHPVYTLWPLPLPHGTVCEVSYLLSAVSGIPCPHKAAISRVSGLRSKLHTPLVWPSITALNCIEQGDLQNLPDRGRSWHTRSCSLSTHFKEWVDGGAPQFQSLRGR